MKAISLLFFLGFSVIPSYSYEVKIPLYFATSADKNYYECLVNLIGSLHQTNYDDLGQIAIFDLGLEPEQIADLNAMEKVQVYPLEMTNPDLLTPFNTRCFGKPVPGWFSWKPVAIKQALDMFPYVFYMDAGTTVYKSLKDFFRYLLYKGYFFHNGFDWPIRFITTTYVIEKLQLHSPEREWILGDTCYHLEAGHMGLTRAYYNSFVLPVYEHTKDIKMFEDDATAQGGFGACRNDQTLYSIYAYLLGLTIHHHNSNPEQPLLLDLCGQKIPFQIASLSEYKNEHTHVYCSRTWEVKAEYYRQFIHYR